MKEKEYAVVALKDILRRALGAMEMKGYEAGFENCPQRDEGKTMLGGWDLEFAAMSREEQAEWLLRLFEALIEHG